MRLAFSKAEADMNERLHPTWAMKLRDFHESGAYVPRICRPQENITSRYSAPLSGIQAPTFPIMNQASFPSTRDRRSFIMTWPSLVLSSWLMLAGFMGATASQAQTDFDLVIGGGTVYDGTGGPAIRADVGIKDGRIVRLGSLADASSQRRINATGLAVAPGFIDMHAHIDPILRLPGGESSVRQGITTALGGPDGGGPWPFGEHLAELEKTQLGLNVAFLVGHNNVRKAVLGLFNRPPTSPKLAEMEQHVEQAMKEGAFGLSTGLKYLPGTFAKTDEIIALAKVAARHGGIYTSHLRDEGSQLIPAVEEAIEIGRVAGLPVVLTHHKVIGKPSWGSSVKTLAIVDAARASGQNVVMDQYPYTASATGISIIIPSWALAGGASDFKQRVANPEELIRLKAEIAHLIRTDRGAGDIGRIQFASVKWKSDLVGRTLRDWCVERGMEPTPENGADLVIEAQLNGGVSCIFHAIDEEDVERIMRHPMTMIASDGRLSEPSDTDQPHPRCYGTFPRVLGLYVREKKILTLEDAIRKMTQQPARTLGIKDRGEVKEGFAADLVVFDPATVRDTATFTAPHQYPVGIPYVLVNGAVIVDNGKFTQERSGKVLRGPAYQR
jgi:N-acyl-D-amino-acid deacylase